MSLTDLIQQAAEMPDLSTAPAGKYIMRIVKLEERKSKNSDREMLAVLLSFTGEESQVHLPVNDNLVYPLPSDADNTKSMFLRRIKDFITCFGIDPSTFTPDNFSDLIGTEGWVNIKEEDDPTYGLQNKVGRYLPPSQ